MAGRQLGGRCAGDCCRRRWRAVSIRFNWDSWATTHRRARHNEQRRQNYRRECRIARRSGKPFLELSIVVGVQIPQLGFTRMVPLNVQKMGVNKGACVLLCALMLMNMQKRRLHKGERKRQVHQDAKERAHLPHRSVLRDDVVLLTRVRRKSHPSHKFACDRRHKTRRPNHQLLVSSRQSFQCWYRE